MIFFLNFLYAHFADKTRCGEQLVEDSDGIWVRVLSLMMF
jgi:hypothetical protein